MALCNESAIVAAPRELPKPLKRGPLGGCLGICFLCDGTDKCVFILRVHSFAAGVRLYGVVIDHAVVSCWV